MAASASPPPLPMRQGGQQAGVIRKPAQPGVQGGVCGGGMCQQQLAFGQLQVQLALFGGVGRVGGDGVLIVLGGSGKLAGLLQQPAGLQQARPLRSPASAWQAQYRASSSSPWSCSAQASRKAASCWLGSSDAGPAQAVDMASRWPNCCSSRPRQRCRAATCGHCWAAGHSRAWAASYWPLCSRFHPAPGWFPGGAGAGVGVLGQAERLFGVAQRQLLPGLGQQRCRSGWFRACSARTVGSKWPATQGVRTPR